MVKKKYHDIRIYNGEVFDLAFKVLDTEDQVVDLTGAAVTAQLREYPQHDEPPFDFEVRHNHSGGRITMTMTAEHTALIGYPYGTYDVYVTFPNGHVECVLWGKAFIISDVSRVQGGTQQIILAFMSFDDFPEIGNLYRLYLDCDEGNLYRWTGTQYVNALEGLRGLPGEDGVGILEIRKVHTTPDGLTDTYEIEYTNGETWLYYVHNGNGIVSIQKIGTSGVIDTYRISMQDGTHSDFTVRNGKGITSIYKIGTEGLVDTYRIAFNDSSIMDFTVTNGKDGVGSIVVVRNREAYVSTLNTLNIDAIPGLYERLKGDPGPAGPTGPTGPTGPAGTTPQVSVGQVTTLSSGSPATVTEGALSTPTHLYLDFGIPMGPQGAEGTSVPFAGITGDPNDNTPLSTALAGKAPASHNHDNRYYTETEMDTKLAGKSNTNHTHDDRYYTESEMDTKLAGKSNTNHTHDDRYYTESEMDTKMAGVLPLSGGVMTGVLQTISDVVTDDPDTGALDLNNSNLYGVNALYTADAAVNAKEGIHFRRDTTHCDTLWIAEGKINFVPNRTYGTATTSANSQKVGRFISTPVSDRIVATDGAAGGLKTLSAPLPIGNGGTGSSTEKGARQNLFGDNLSSTATHLLAITSGWTNGGYIAKADAADWMGALKTSTQSCASFAAIPTTTGFFLVSYSSASDANAPVTTSGTYFWNVIQLGTSTRLVQIAMNAFATRNTIYFREKHDNTWYGWYKMVLGDSGWTAITNTNVYTNSINYRKVGAIVYVTLSEIYLKAARDGTAWTTLATLPSGNRPSTTIFTPLGSRGNANIGVISIDSNGLIKITATGGTLATNQCIYTSVCFPV